ncbi:ABC transporter permease [Aliivibrio finisterrensis]|uniref:ABC transporter permease n=1 Tax=Aliivibrio finisterrensis TaxID=511998 RepID=A0A4Q5KIN7_9GAMM|nr:MULTISPECIES: ABC transporter permease [Aliivibrio]MDD9175882.1 ABC transporter permease [Aliivibrio sp. S3TY1]MDD9192864.1 ABC transporter permease [Aliivibrio sp. S2TY2]RYU46006.1 ABC transporter permease [Aliivibrio finisterrensis]
MKAFWRSYYSNPWLIAVTFALPLVLSLVIWWIFSSSVVRELPLDVVDLDQSSLSRMIIRDYDATPTLAVRTIQPNVTIANRALKEGDNYGYIVIPHDFERNVMLGKSPQISGFYNGQFILIAKQINSALMQTDMTIQAKLATIKALSTKQSTWTQAINSAVPIKVQVTALFNIGSNYNQFLVSAILPAIWQMAIIVGMIWAMKNESVRNNNNDLREWFDSQTPQNILSFVGVYFLIGMTLGCVLFYFLFGVLRFPFDASILSFLITMGAMTLACISIGIAIGYGTNNIVKAMSISGAYTAPSFAFLGVTFPVSDMNNVAVFWHSILPASHFVRSQIEQANYGYGLVSSFSHVGILLLFTLPLLLLISRLRK